MNKWKRGIVNLRGHAFYPEWNYTNKTASCYLTPPKPVHLFQLIGLLAGHDMVVDPDAHGLEWLSSGSYEGHAGSRALPAGAAPHDVVVFRHQLDQV